MHLGNKNFLKVSEFEQYEHLSYLIALIAEKLQLAAALGNDYLVTSDVVIYRDLYEDEEINAAQYIIDDSVSKWRISEG